MPLVGAEIGRAVVVGLAVDVVAGVVERDAGVDGGGRPGTRCRSGPPRQRTGVGGASRFESPVAVEPSRARMLRSRLFSSVTRVFGKRCEIEANAAAPWITLLWSTRVPRACSSSMPVSKNSKPGEMTMHVVANEPVVVADVADAGVGVVVVGAVGRIAAAVPEPETDAARAVDDGVLFHQGVPRSGPEVDGVLGERAVLAVNADEGFCRGRASRAPDGRRCRPCSSRRAPERPRAGRRP